MDQLCTCCLCQRYLSDDSLLAVDAHVEDLISQESRKEALEEEKKNLKKAKGLH